MMSNDQHRYDWLDHQPELSQKSRIANFRGVEFMQANFPITTENLLGA